MNRSGRRRALALLFGAATALVLSEATLRIVRPARLSQIVYPCIYQPDPVLGFRYAPRAHGRVAGHFEIDNEVRTNSLGFYDDEPLAPGDSDLRVLAVGDSFTAAMNVPVENVWTSVLERELRARVSPRADVVNLGLDGTGTDVHVALLREQIPVFQPDVVIVAFFGNDARDVLNGRFERECYRDYVLSYQTPEQRATLRARVDDHLSKVVRRWIFDHSLVARAVMSLGSEPLDPYRIRFLQPRAEELGIDRDSRRGRRGALDAALQELASLAATCDCRLLVAPVPPRPEPGGSLAIWRRNAGPLRLPVLDVVPFFERTLAADGRSHADLYFRHDSHFNSAGNELYGRAIAEQLVPLLAASRDDPKPE